MRLNCGPTAQEKEQNRMMWHQWFAWYPVRVAPGDCRWLEIVQRRYEAYYRGAWIVKYQPYP